MTRVDRYVLAQLLLAFGVTALVLVGIYWVNRAVRIFDQLINDGQTVTIFAAYMTLLLPQIILILMPLCAFASAIYVMNRLNGESEMVVLKSAGLGPARVLWPVLVFGLILMLISSALAHYLVPLSRIELARLQDSINRDITAQMVSAGQFVHPSEGLTFFVRESDPRGKMTDVFLHDTRDPDLPTTYLARSASLIQGGGKASLVMFDGELQTVTPERNQLATVGFDDLVFDLTPFLTDVLNPEATLRGYSTWAALNPTPRMLEVTGATVERFRFEAHDRLSQPFMVIVFALVGAASLMLGEFSRHQTRWQSGMALGLLVLFYVIVNAVKGLVRDTPEAWPLFYAYIPIGLAILGGILLSLRRSRRPWRRMAA